MEVESALHLWAYCRLPIIERHSVKYAILMLALSIWYFLGFVYAAYLKNHGPLDDSSDRWHILPALLDNSCQSLNMSDIAVVQCHSAARSFKVRHEVWKLSALRFCTSREQNEILGAVVYEELSKRASNSAQTPNKQVRAV